MPLMMDIQAATEQGRHIRNLYAQLRVSRSTSERAELLRDAGECADHLGRQLRHLAEQAAHVEQDDDIRSALGQLGEVMEQVMVQEREYRIATGAAPDEPDPAHQERV